MKGPLPMHPIDRMIRRIQLTEFGGRDADLEIARMLHGDAVHVWRGRWMILKLKGGDRKVRRDIPQYTLDAHRRRIAINLLRKKKAARMPARMAA